MNQKEVKKLQHGLYRLYWKQGGTSLASVGSLHDGTRWFAPCNWTSVSTEKIANTDWKIVSTVIRLYNFTS